MTARRLNTRIRILGPNVRTVTYVVTLFKGPCRTIHAGTVGVDSCPRTEHTTEHTVATLPHVTRPICNLLSCPARALKFAVACALTDRRAARTQVRAVALHH